MPSLNTPLLPVQTRALLDVSLTATSLSDDVILLPAYFGGARLEVLRLFPTAETTVVLTEQIAAQGAVAAFTAARIAPALPQIVRLTVGEDTVQRKDWNVAEQVARLRALAREVLAPVLADPADPPRVAHFWVLPGGRGR